MDRLNRALVGGCLAAALGMLFSSAGCRSMKNDVPPGKPYSTTGGAPPTVGFNSDPPRNTGVGGGMYTNGLAPNSPGSGVSSSLPGATSASPYGTPPPASSPYGASIDNRYGGAGSAAGANP